MPLAQSVNPRPEFIFSHSLRLCGKSLVRIEEQTSVNNLKNIDHLQLKRIYLKAL